jgi:hypothetical protein
MTDEYGPGSASWAANERERARQMRMFQHSMQLHLVRGYQAALTDIKTARDNGGWEAVQEWLQNNLTEGYPLAPQERTEGTGQIAKGPFVEDFQRRLRAVLALRTGWEIPESTFVAVSTRYATNDSHELITRGNTGWIGLAAVLQEGEFAASYDYDEPGAWSKLLADLEAVDP